jgi:hypothetical protein
MSLERIKKTIRALLEKVSYLSVGTLGGSGLV